MSLSLDRRNGTRVGKGQPVAENSDSPMEGKLVCGAKTRSGGTCQKPPIKGKKRCRLHGGASNNPAPKGNTRALKHGLYSSVISDEEKRLWEHIELGTIDDELRLARVKLRRLLAFENAQNTPQDAGGATNSSRKGMTLEEVRVLTDGRSRQTEMVQRRVDYTPEIRGLLKTIGDLEKTRAAIGTRADDPETMARKVQDALHAIHLIQEGIPVGPDEAYEAA